MKTQNNPEESIRERIERELKEETKREVEYESRQGAVEAYSLVFLLLSLIVLIYCLITREYIPIWAIVIIAIGDILSLRGLGIF